MSELDFWTALDVLVEKHTIALDRPRGTAHPRYPEMIYPLDYGYLEGTCSGDGADVDVWIGSLENKRVTAVIITTDLKKEEVEIKLLLGCTNEEIETALRMHQRGMQSALLIKRVQEDAS